MKTLKTTLFFTLLWSFTIYGQDFELTFSQEHYNSNECVTSAILEYTIPIRSNRKYSISIYRRGELIETKKLGRKRPGTYSAGTIVNPSSTTVILRSRKSIGSKRIHASKILIRCQNDRDSDGFLNDKDKCPDVYAGRQNYGCPGIPDYFTTGKTEIAAPGWGHRNLQYATSSNNPIFLSRFDGGFIHFTKLLFKNIGDGDGLVSPVKIHFYISKDGKISDDDFKFSKYAVYSQKLKVGETTTYSLGPDVKLLGSSVGNKLNYGWYRLLIVVDEENFLSDVDSIYSIPLEYVNTHIGHSNKTSKEKLSHKLNHTNIVYDLYIYMILQET